MIDYARNRTRSSWQSMIRRCTNPSHSSYARYGGRGITVCDRWFNFENFLADMGERPEGMSLDRWPDNDGNYEPSNCRWATRVEQMWSWRSRERCVNGHLFTPENTRFRANGTRCCRQCDAIRQKHYRERYDAVLSEYVP